MERFTSLTRALLTVSNKELKEEQQRNDDQKTGRRGPPIGVHKFTGYNSRLWLYIVV
jgi:hypothetical protein